MAGDVAALRDLAALKDVTFAFERCESRLCEMFTPDYHLVSTPPSSLPLPPSFSFSLPPRISSSGSLLLVLSRKFLSLFVYLGVSLSRLCGIFTRNYRLVSLCLSSFSRFPSLARARCLSSALFFSFSPFVRSFSLHCSLSRALSILIFPPLSSSFSISRTHSLSLAYPLTLLSLALSLFPPRTSRFYK